MKWSSANSFRYNLVGHPFLLKPDNLFAKYILSQGTDRPIVCIFNNCNIINPKKYSMTICKVGQEFGPSFPEDVYELIASDSPCWTSTKLDKYTWKRIPRPMYPLDNN